MTETTKLNEHYRTLPGEQHHQRVARLQLNWYAANITKYAERAEVKGKKVEDIKKIIDYANLWLEETNKYEEATKEYVNQDR